VDEDEGGFNPLVNTYVAPLAPRKGGSASSWQSSVDCHDSVEDHRFGKRLIRLDWAVSNGVIEGREGQGDVDGIAAAADSTTDCATADGL